MRASGAHVGGNIDVSERACNGAHRLQNECLNQCLNQCLTLVMRAGYQCVPLITHPSMCIYT